MINIDVIAMAREASDPDKVDPWRDGFWVLTQEELERFAALVRADAIVEEREACAKVCEEPVAWMHWLHGPIRLFLNKDEAMMELDRLNREYPVDADGRKMRPLVFGDTPQPQKALTDEKLFSIINPSETEQNKNDFVEPVGGSYGITYQHLVRFARAIEAAHGIKGENT